MSAFNYPLPPSFMNDGWTYTLAIFSLLSIFLLMLEWGWRICWSMADDRRKLVDPLTVERIVKLLLVIGILMGVSGDVFLLMMWPEITPETRIHLSNLDRFLDGICVVPFVLSWFISLYSQAVLNWQLVRLPIPVNLWPSLESLRRPAAIGVLVMGISLVVTLLR